MLQNLQFGKFGYFGSIINDEFIKIFRVNQFKKSKGKLSDFRMESEQR